MQFKKIALIFVAMVIAAMAIPASADDYMDSVDQYKGRVDKYFESVKIYERSVDNKNRVVDERLNDLEAREQQQQSPPAGQFWPESASQPTVVAGPVPASTWGWRYYRYWDTALADWIFAPIWCPANWIAPHDWYSVSYNDRYRFRHFSHGRVDRGRAFFNRPVDLHPHGIFHGNRAGANNMHGMARPQVQQPPHQQHFGDRQPQGQFQPRGNGNAPVARPLGPSPGNRPGFGGPIPGDWQPQNFQRQPQRGQLQPRGNVPIMQQQAPLQNFGGRQQSFQQPRPIQQAPMARPQPQMQPPHLQAQPQPQYRPAQPPARPQNNGVPGERRH